MEIENLDKLTTLGHAGRMSVFRLLIRRFPNAVPAGEIAGSLDIKPSTLSVYLSALTGVGLITQIRQGTSRLYRVNMKEVQALSDFLFQDCCSGRSDLSADTRWLPQGNPSQKPYNVLFLCTGNSARSILAECLLRDIGAGNFMVYSAGTSPKSEPNPAALELLESLGHDVSSLSSKPIEEFQGAEAPKMDFVLTVCNQAANEDGKPWNGAPINGHWGLPDPAAGGEASDIHRAFRDTYTALQRRITAFAALPFSTLDRMSIQAAVDAIAQSEHEELK